MKRAHTPVYVVVVRQNVHGIWSEAIRLALTLLGARLPRHGAEHSAASHHLRLTPELCAPHQTLAL